MRQAKPVTRTQVAGLERSLVRTQELLRSGLTERNIAHHVKTGELIRLRRSWYTGKEAWTSPSMADQHLLAMIAVRGAAETTPVFSHRSAATLHGLPVWSPWMERIFHKPASDPRIVALTKSARHGTVGGFLSIHRSDLDPEEVGSIAGFMCTSPVRTIIDLARTEPFGIALACTDSLLNQLFSTNRVIDEAAWHEWRTQLIAYTHDRPRQRGMAIVRKLAILANPGAESPLESVSRLRMHQLGIRVELQVPVPSENGGTLHVDFKLPDFNAFGECDGKVKYFDAEMLNGESAAEVVHKEKLRHDWIVGTTNMRGIHWGAKDVTTAAVFARRLRAFRIEVPGKPTKEFGKEIATFLGRLP
ncbi:type IV toxin-antitoxin system AbiEi family antitoxin domain-containing protein [Leucobacter viscericola]|uniref:Type IV toxin-antitoxin system AbiEi family antitoxin domain-containing protein n=1 Tax=Leucobacter viscericola TaxID=2714935 RepID=A0A6G7XDD3_9MICO|nr:type IV toxin-antitoxin system AbiEi family antitoxin domain-containing protein [Leucobacter viscericola]QIK62604.1 type IV toxin-antitoxin system AbiEi family antitoxin domain-containing protein [Leucobacter viscericola]